MGIHAGIVPEVKNVHVWWVEKFLNNFVCFTQDTQKNAIFVDIKPASFDSDGG